MATLFSPKTPAIKPAAPMPDKEDPALMAAEQQRRAAMLARGGRASTILADQTGGTGGGDFSRKTAG